MSISSRAKLTGLILASLVAASPAIGHGKTTHAAAHGGKVVESGHHHVEIVANDGTIVVYVNGEDGKPEDVQKATATAAILSGGKKVDVTLTPDPSNVLKGSGAFTAGKGATIVITLTMPGHKPEQMRVKLD
jgi:hypothetical protein